ncbi:MAG: S41 family peptidase [Candidatus Eisenbacteria bacterium]
MRSVPLALAFACSFALAAPAAAAPFPADSLFALVRARSVHAGHADWAAIERAWRTRLAAARTLADSAQTFVGVFESLGDPHSRLVVRGRGYAWWRQLDDSTLARLGPWVRRSSEERALAANATLGGGRWRYLRVGAVSEWGDAMHAVTRAIESGACAGDDVRGVIVDLRLNAGGQLAAMLGGLAPLLGDGLVATSVNGAGILTRTFALDSGAVRLDGDALTRGAGACDRRRLPVAVLVGPVTISSGSITALAFRGRPHTRLFGEPTASGYTTGNDWLQVTDDVALNLATGFFRDRTGREYRDAVEPDVLVRGVTDFDDPARDDVVRAAVNWLEREAKQPRSSRRRGAGAER